MYETGTTGQNADLVRYGVVRDIKPAGNVVTFRFIEEGRFTRDIVLEFSQRLGIHANTEYGHTHWALKDGHLPSAMLTKLNRTSTIPDALNPPALESLPAATNARLEQFRKLRKEWSAQGHPLGIALDKLRTPDLVRAIEAKA